MRRFFSSLAARSSGFKRSRTPLSSAGHRWFSTVPKTLSGSDRKL